VIRSTRVGIRGFRWDGGVSDPPLVRCERRRNDVLRLVVIQRAFISTSVFPSVGGYASLRVVARLRFPAVVIIGH